MVELDDAGERGGSVVEDDDEGVDNSELERPVWNELLGESLTARWASSGTTSGGRRGEEDEDETLLAEVGVVTVIAGERDLVWRKCGDVSMGHKRPLLRFTYSCHLGLLKSGGGAEAVTQGSGLLGICLPR